MIVSWVQHDKQVPSKRNHKLSFKVIIVFDKTLQNSVIDNVSTQ